MNEASQDFSVVNAGPFGLWLNEFCESLASDRGTSVPCGDCVGCCVSSYHIPIRPQDKDAAARIPVVHLVTAQGQAAGHRMMRYLADGKCPMLSDKKCTIYEVRPQTCRDYDCRVFAAAGIEAGGPDKQVINARVRAWRFIYESDSERRAHDAIRAAANFIRTHSEAFPHRRAPTAPTGIAVLAVKAHRIFLDSRYAEINPGAVAQAIIDASRAFDESINK